MICENGIKHMRRVGLSLGCLLCLSGCYTVNNERFATDIRARVTPGMDVSTATNRLKSNGFDCDSRSAAPAITCTKTRQSLLPYTCIERVNLFLIGMPAQVDHVEVPKIMCAGL
jgi:hypothetical protein